MDKFIVKDGKKLRYGYTTGSCVAAGVKAGLYHLFEEKTLKSLKLLTPKGWEIDIDINYIKSTEEGVMVSIIKDSGDDPDITNNIEIITKIVKNNSGIINIIGGKGIGLVTKDGLSVKRGEKAINPTPLKEIKKIIKTFDIKGSGLDIEIIVPKGEELAKKTYNPKLGIIGGISIIGTTGIVEPMSDEGYTDTISLELRILRKKGTENLILTPGNYGKDFLRESNISGDIIKFSNYIGYALDDASIKGFKNVLLIGHIGKLIKVAGGIFNTHSKVADCRLEIFAAYLALMVDDKSLIKKIMNAITTEEAVDIIKENDLEDIFNIIANKIAEKCIERTYGNLNIGVLIFSQKHGLLAKSNEFKEVSKVFIK